MANNWHKKRNRSIETNRIEQTASDPKEYKQRYVTVLTSSSSQTPPQNTSPAEPSRVSSQPSSLPSSLSKEKEEERKKENKGENEGEKEKEKEKEKRRGRKTFYYAAPLFGGQKEDVYEQVQLFKNNGAKNEFIFMDSASCGRVLRTSYQLLKNEYLREGDILVIESLCRIGNRIETIVKELQYFKEHNIHLRVMDIPALAKPISYSDPTATDHYISFLYDSLFSVSSVMKTDAERRKKRIAEREAAKRKKGRPSNIPSNWEQVYADYKGHKLTWKEAVKAAKVSETTFYRLIKKEDAKSGGNEQKGENE